MVKRKKKMGRPFKKPKDRRSKPVTIRLTPDEHKQLLKDTQDNNLSISDYLKNCWQKARAEK